MPVASFPSCAYVCGNVCVCMYVWKVCECVWNVCMYVWEHVCVCVYGMCVYVCTEGV